MVGNDIVDLYEARNSSNWQRPRFLNKLFTEQEQVYIYTAKPPFLMVWRLWSMKEASYKLYTQINPGRFYNPKAFECTIKKNSGFVKMEEFQCFVVTKISSNYIISEARLKEQKMGSEIVKFRISNQKEQSRELKRRLLKELGAGYQLLTDVWNIPRISTGKEFISVSLTHHGSYGAYVIA